MKNNYFNVAELIENPSALTREQGSVVYNVIVPLLRNGENITLDFADVESLITPFLNVAIGKLYEDFSSEQLNDQLKYRICQKEQGLNSNWLLRMLKSIIQIRSCLKKCRGSD